MTNGAEPTAQIEEQGARRCTRCDHWAVVDHCTICGAEDTAGYARISVERQRDEYIANLKALSDDDAKEIAALGTSYDAVVARMVDLEALLRRWRAESNRPLFGRGECDAQLFADTNRALSLLEGTKL